MDDKYYPEFMEIPCYPDFVPMSLDLKPEMHPHLSLTPDGVSEYTFSNLYLFRQRYHYRVSRTSSTFIISGEREGKHFFSTPCAAPDRETLEDLFKTHQYWKGISDSVLTPVRPDLEEWGIEFTEDRDNFDYLYLRTDLAELSGQRFHKKRNLVNAFTAAYESREQPLTPDLVPQAIEILDQWREDKNSEGDYTAAREALELFHVLKMRGMIYYVNNRPAAWCLGESLKRGRMFAVHFEKGLNKYKGIYQHINQAFAASLPHYYTFVNREQDLGDEGLRQAKMTYRPVGFVKKFVGNIVK
jgi:hypothetical protein